MSSTMRAFHLDLKRAMWRRTYMDATVEHLRRWGFNAIVYELEDKLRLAKHPALAHPDAWSREDTAAFARECRAKGVEVIPLVQSLGHAEYVVGRPEYAHLREAPDIADQYDPLSDDARGLIVELFDAAIEAFRPQRYFHMGGDETWSLGKSERCAPVVQSIGVGGLYVRHMIPLFEHIRNRGLRPIIWADMVLTYPEIIQDIPDYVVLMDWDYWTREERPSSLQVWGTRPALRWGQYAESTSPIWRERFGRYAVDRQTSHDGTFRSFFYTEALREAGFEVLTASAARSFGDMVGTPANGVHWPNAFYSARAGAARANGNLVTSWAVRHSHPELSLPAAFAAAKGAEGDATFDADLLGKEFTADRYGVEMPEFALAAYRQAATAINLGQAHHLLAAQQKLRSGQDPVAQAVAELERTTGGRTDAIAEIQAVREGYLAAAAAFEEMRRKARVNVPDLALWVEGVRLNILYADFLLAAVAGELPERASEFLERLSRLREQTSELFSDTYEARSVEEELDLRYGFHADYLRGLARN